MNLRRMLFDARVAARVDCHRMQVDWVRFSRIFAFHVGDEHATLIQRSFTQIIALTLHLK